MSGVVEIRTALKEDVETIVEIHLDAFKDFFLTSLGKDFLTFYYSCFISSCDGVVMCIEVDDKIVGFSAIALDCRGFNIRLIKRNFFSFVFCGFKLLFTSPGALVRLLKNLTKKSVSIDDAEDYAELYSLGVLRECQGKGIGKTLLMVSETYVREQGMSRMSLTTDFYNNSSALKFYAAMGYSVLYDFISYPNRRMYRLIKNI